MFFVVFGKDVIYFRVLRVKIGHVEPVPCSLFHARGFPMGLLTLDLRLSTTNVKNVPKNIFAVNHVHLTL